MRIAIIGSGHVGLVTGACLAEKKHKVICVDSDRRKIESLRKLVVPFYEPGLPEMVRRNHKAKRLGFSTDISQAVRFAEVIFISVGTPLGKWGGANLSQIRRVSREIADNLNSQYKVIVEKSTVPVGTADEMERIIRMHAPRGARFDIVSNPEFLQEGSAIRTTLYPDRIVFGVKTAQAEKAMRKVFGSFRAPILVTDIKSAELIKHAANSFLALKISYANALSNVCEKSGADIRMVTRGIGMDKRINPHFLNAGIGYGGFCFPKDVAAFIHISNKLGYDFSILKAVQKTNVFQREVAVNKIKKALGGTVRNKHIAVWGLSFKPNTDDIRESPSLYIIEELLRQKARIRAYDPQAMHETRKVLPHIHYCATAYEALRKSDCLFIATEWNEFRKANLARVKKLLRKPVIIDGRNIFEPTKMKHLGFVYYGIGRS
ncbi:MAG: UDP-glucose/GDP-mannose dehydrogenase family protein [Planctomycetota bacterium]